MIFNWKKSSSTCLILIQVAEMMVILKVQIILGCVVAVVVTLMTGIRRTL